MDMDKRSVLQLANTIDGFMLYEEMEALWDLVTAEKMEHVVEIGSFLGRSTVVLGHAIEQAHDSSGILVSVDHHCGSAEHQPGGGWEMPGTITADGLVNTLPRFRDNIRKAGIEDKVMVLAMDSAAAAKVTQCRYLFNCLLIDGAHDRTSVMRDLLLWSAKLYDRGCIMVHDYDPSGMMRPKTRGVTEAVDLWMETTDWRLDQVAGGRYGTLAILRKDK